MADSVNDGSGDFGVDLKPRHDGIRYPGGQYGHRMPGRREKAKEMAEFRASISDQEQIKRLDERLGVGIGAYKERARLNASIKGGK